MGRKNFPTEETRIHDAPSNTSIPYSPSPRSYSRTGEAQPVPPNNTTTNTNIDKVGQYHVIQQIGEGEFGYVFQAELANANTSEYYAVKVLKAPYTGKKYRQQLHQEAATLQNLRHKSLPRFIEIGSDSRGPYLVMEFVPGETLRFYQEKSIVPVDKALYWAYELVEGLRYLHSQNVIHRDLKPSNIQITQHQRNESPIRILDFGIALLRGKSLGKGVVGSLPYMSPEQLAGKTVREPSDIYALGLVLFQLFTGSYAYPNPPSTNDPTTWKKFHENATPPPLHETKIPSDVADITLKCLNTSPEKRPTAKEVLNVLEKHITGVGLPSYVGIVGVRGSGKTCYLTSLYGEPEISKETISTLEDYYLSLYEEGELPSATALHTSHLNLMVDTDSRTYQIVTKDYGGEILKGRVEERKGEEKYIDQELLEEKRAEVYGFFQNARAILVLLETLPEKNRFRDTLNLQKQVESLFENIANLANGKRRTAPIALVLTKWDRNVDGIYENPDNFSWDPKVEKQRALDYIHSVDWTRTIYQKVKALASCFEVFPVFSFIGDKPDTEHIRSFNLLSPLLWAAEKGEHYLWEIAQLFHQENTSNYREVLPFYWRLLHIEKIPDPAIRKQIEEILTQLSQEYLQTVKERARQHPDELRRIIGEYREFLHTKGIQPAQQEEAKRSLAHYTKKLANKQRKRVVTWIAVVLLLIYGTWELWSYYQIQQALVRFQQRELRSHEFLSSLYDYQWYKPISLPRQYLEPQITKKAIANVERRFAQEIETYQRWVREPLPDVPKQPSFSKHNENLVEERLKIARKTLEKYNDRIEKLSGLQELRHRWLEHFDIESTGIQTLPLEKKLQELQHHRLQWVSREEFLARMKQSFTQHKELALALEEKLIPELATLKSSLTQAQPETLAEGLANAQKLLEKLKEAQQQLQDYLEKYPQSPFQDEIAQMSQESSTLSSDWQNRINRLTKDQNLYHNYQAVLQFEQKHLPQYTPRPTDTKLLLEHKKRKIEKHLGLCQDLLHNIREKKLAIDKDSVEKWQENCQRILPKLEEKQKKCAYFLELSTLEQLFQLGQQQPGSKDNPQSLKEKMSTAQNAFQKLRDRQLPSNSLLPEDARNWKQKKLQYQQQLSQTITTLQKSLQNLQNLAAECENIARNWRSKIQKDQSYVTTLDKIAQLLEEIEKFSYLNRNYRQQFQQVDEQIRELRIKDRRGYREIEELVRRHRFGKVYKAIEQYQQSPDHLHIMSPALQKYEKEFKSEVEAIIYLTPSSNFSNDTDFQLTISTGKKPSKVFYKEDAEGLAKMGVIRISTTSLAQPAAWVSVKVVERDPVFNDFYGTFTQDVSALFDNNSVSHSHICANDGSISVTFTPDNISHSPKLPSFKD